MEWIESIAQGGDGRSMTRHLSIFGYTWHEFRLHRTTYHEGRKVYESRVDMNLMENGHGVLHFQPLLHLWDDGMMDKRNSGRRGPFQDIADPTSCQFKSTCHLSTWDVLSVGFVRVTDTPISKENLVVNASSMWYYHELSLLTAGYDVVVILASRSKILGGVDFHPNFCT